VQTSRPSARRVLVDHARGRGYQKRGGAQRVTLTDAPVMAPEPAVDLIDLDRALEALVVGEALKAKTASMRLVSRLGFERQNVGPQGNAGC
jgi:ECF sigma factor